MKNIKSTVVAAVMALSLLVLVPAAFAGNGMGQGRGAGDGTGPVHSILDGLPVVVEGTVVALGTRGNGIEIDTGIDTITVYGLGPVAFWDAAGMVKPQIGEDILVNGYEITLSDGSTRIIAASVVIGGDEIVLRDPETGAPLWRGPNRFNNQNQNRTGDCVSLMETTADTPLIAKGGHGHGGNGHGGHGPGDGTGNGGNGPKDGTGNGKKAGTCTVG